MARTSRLLLCLAALLSALSLLASASAQMAEILPGDPASPESAPAADCCGTPSSPQPAPSQGPTGQNPGSPGSAPDNPGTDAHSSEAGGQSDTDPPNIKKVPMPTRSELAAYQAAQTASRNFGNGFSDRPAWAYAMGDRSATAAMGQAAAGTAPGAPPTSSHVARPMSEGNARLLQELDKDLARQSVEDANGLDSANDGLCFNDWGSLHGRSGMDVEPQLYMANGGLANRLQLVPSRTALQQAMFEGDLSKANPNWVEVPKNRIQSGDTFVIPGYTELDPQYPLDPRNETIVAGHIGVVKYDVATGEWLAVSTNVNQDPRWNLMPLEQMEAGSPVALRFFHWNGPVRSKP